jgi:hypothetical protein
MMSNDTDLHLQFRRVIGILDKNQGADVDFFEHTGDGRTEGEEIAAFDEAVTAANIKSLNSAHIALRDYMAIVNRQLTDEAITTIGVVLRTIDDAIEGNALASSESVFHTALNIRDIAYHEAKTAVNDDRYVGLAQKTHMFARSASHFARIALHEVSELQYIKELRTVEHIFVGDIVPVLTYAQDVYTNACSLLHDATHIMNKKNEAAAMIVLKSYKGAEARKRLEMVSAYEEMCNTNRATVEMTQKVVGLVTNHFKDAVGYICALIDNALSGFNATHLPLYHVLNAYKSILLTLMEVYVVAQAIQNAVHALSEANPSTYLYPLTTSPERIIRHTSEYSMGIKNDARKSLTKHHDVLNKSSVILSEYATQLRRR